MEDLFSREQKILDRALHHMDEIKNGEPCDSVKFETLVREYARLLRQLRSFTKISDRTTVDLNTIKLNLLDKVHFDVLTGIYNRRFFEETMKRMIEKMANADNTILSVLIIDVDYFKKYNDAYGHTMGDQCLNIIAQAINSSIMRTDDFVARYGGEEFVAVLPHTDEHGVSIISERILNSVRACNIPHENSIVADCVTVSIGATTGVVAHAQSGADYVKRADEALYMSKKGGRNRYTFLHFKGREE